MSVCCGFFVGLCASLFGYGILLLGIMSVCLGIWFLLDVVPVCLGIEF